MANWIGFIVGAIVGSFFGVAGFGGAISGAIPGAVIGYLIADWLSLKNKANSFAMKDERYGDWLVEFKASAVRECPDLLGKKAYVFDDTYNNEILERMYLDGMSASFHGLAFGSYMKGVNGKGRVADYLGYDLGHVRPRNSAKDILSGFLAFIVFCIFSLIKSLVRLILGAGNKAETQAKAERAEADKKVASKVSKDSFIDGVKSLAIDVAVFGGVAIVVIIMYKSGEFDPLIYKINELLRR